MDPVQQENSCVVCPAAVPAEAICSQHSRHSCDTAWPSELSHCS